MSIGTNVQRLREERSISQDQLADAVRVHQTHISKIERGVKKPSLEVLQQLAHFFDVSVDDLLDSQPQPDTQPEPI